MRKICVVTGSRAEYGLLFWLLKEIKSDKSLRLQLIATGSHLSDQHGRTEHQILQDGFKIAARVDLKLVKDDAQSVTASMARGLLGFAEALHRLSPDVVVVLGDRYEILMAATAAMMARIPIAHIHGGEVTRGAIDDAMRHAITKMSQIHFVSTEEHAERVIRMGEQPANVFMVGAPGLENARRRSLLNPKQLEEALSLSFKEPFFLVTYHPETLSEIKSQQSFKELLKALDRFPQFKIIFTSANADTGGEAINRLIDEYVRTHSSRSASFVSMGSLHYLSAMKCARLALGNSSSGIIEAPFFKVPTVNIGSRQGGRPCAASVFNCEGYADQIGHAIRKALNARFKNLRSVYGQGHTARMIKNELKRINLNRITRKIFYDGR